MREKEKERLRLVRAFNEEWICPHYVILGHFSKKRDQKESHPPSFLFFVSFCSLEFLSFFLDFASFFTHKSHTRLIVIVIINSSSSIQER